MARIRSIHYDALKSEKLARSSAEAERLYWRLSTHCDDEGRAEDDPQVLAAYLFPRSDEITGTVVDGWLDELATVGLIVRYKAGNAYLQVTRWLDYQKPNRPTKSKLPPPPHGVLSEDSVSAQGVVSAGEGEGDGHAQRDRASFDSDFAAWWEHYPRKVQKAAAFTAYKARRRDGTDHATLVAALDHYASSVEGVELRFVMHGSRFLNGKAGPWSEWVNGPPEPGIYCGLYSETKTPIAKQAAPEVTRAVLGRGPDAPPVWELDDHGNAVAPAC